MRFFKCLQNSTDIWIIILQQCWRIIPRALPLENAFSEQYKNGIFSAVRGPKLHLLCEGLVIATVSCAGLGSLLLPCSLVMYQSYSPSTRGIT